MRNTRRILWVTLLCASIVYSSFTCVSAEQDDNLAITLKHVSHKLSADLKKRTPQPTGRVLVFVPIFQFPSGGIRVLYKLVRALRTQGIDAHVWIFPKTTGKHAGRTHRWLTDMPDVPLSYQHDNLFADDILIFSDAYFQHVKNPYGKEYPNRRIMYVLNHHYLAGSKCCEKYPRVDLVMSNCLTSVRLLSKQWQRHAVFVPTSVNQALYFPATNPLDLLFRKTGDVMKDNSKRPIVVAYVPRKSGYLLDWIKKLLPTMSPMLAEEGAVEWLALEGMDESTYAAALRRTDVYLVCGRSGEGNNLSVLEAMLSGAIVIGYSGGGGDDFMVGASQATLKMAVDAKSKYSAQLRLASNNETKRHSLLYGHAAAETMDVLNFFNKAVQSVAQREGATGRLTAEQIKRFEQEATTTLTAECVAGRLQNVVKVKDADYWWLLRSLVAVMVNLLDKSKGRAYYALLRHCARVHAEQYPVDEKGVARHMGRLIRHFSHHVPVDRKQRELFDYAALVSQVAKDRRHKGQQEEGAGEGEKEDEGDKEEEEKQEDDTPYVAPNLQWRDDEL